MLNLFQHLPETLKQVQGDDQFDFLSLSKSFSSINCHFDGVKGWRNLILIQAAKKSLPLCHAELVFTIF
ncbi:hypothetical protein ML462_01760 [Gramella lutea]|uniref:Uncharacterized protein n=1 Tax=Christiangramia lutea TaxID=1607951 RepID=A0A9X1V0L6_9FLAO|nr:hypothetical protein [Christiangramia lutea]MCH4821884.1 hypothetical protein [Christiangramia lutea]